MMLFTCPDCGAKILLSVVNNDPIRVKIGNLSELDRNCPEVMARAKNRNGERDYMCGALSNAVGHAIMGTDP
jgi:hypothetical protein